MNMAEAAAKAKTWGIRLLVGVVLLTVGGFGLYTLFTLKYSYSKGDRVGFVQKLSKRGWLCKTNEGELAMVNMPGQPATMFSFTVPDDHVSQEIDGFAGHRVVLTYEEHRGIPFGCFGDTGYFVVGVRKTE